MKRHDTIVVGLGAMGAAVSHALASRGQRVLGIERFTLAHDRGSSHGRTRIIRKSYFEHPAYVPMVDRAMRMWRTIEAETHRELLVPCGLFIAGAADSAILAGVSRAGAEHDLNLVSMSADQAKDRFHGFQYDPAMRILYEPDAGFLRVEECVAALLTLAQRRGAELRTGETVRGWSADAGGVRVQTDDSEYVGKTLVIAAGAWTADLLPDLGRRLSVRRKVQLWFRPATDDYQRRRGCPVFAYDAKGRFFYGFPAQDNGLIKVAEHTGEQAVSHADSLDRGLHGCDCQAVQAFIRRFLPGVSADVVEHSVCMYTMTPDEHFIIDRHPHHDNVFIAGGFSGHGFKFAPLVGTTLADVITTGHTRLPIGLFTADRPAIRYRRQQGD